DLSLGFILRDQGVLDEEDNRILDGLVARQLHRHGDARKSLASLRLDREALGQLEGLTDDELSRALTSLGSAIGTPPAPLRSRGTALTPSQSRYRYRRQRLHAKGGLGQVFVALDEELNREVALKEIQGALRGQRR